MNNYTDYNKLMVSIAPFIKVALELLFGDHSRLTQSMPFEEHQQAEVRAWRFAQAVALIPREVFDRMQWSKQMSDENNSLPLIEHRFTVFDGPHNDHWRGADVVIPTLDIAEIEIIKQYRLYRSLVDLLRDIDDLHQYFSGNVKGLLRAANADVTDQALFERHRTTMRSVLDTLITRYSLGVERVDFGTASDTLIERAVSDGIASVAKQLRDHQRDRERIIPRR